MNHDDLVPLRHFRCACFGGAAAAPGPEGDGFDPAVRFQDDLFRAVNGRWLEATQIPSDRARYGNFVKLADVADERVRAIVDELAATAPAPASLEGQVGAYYAAWLDTEAIDRAGLAPLQAELDALAALRTPRELAQWLGRMQGGLNTPVRLSVAPDFEQPGIHRAFTWQGGLGLPDRDYYRDTTDARMASALAAYATYLERLATLIGEADPAAAAARVIGIERRIADVHWPAEDNRDAAKVYNPMTPDELARRAPGFAWAAFLDAAGLGGIDRLSVSQPRACAGIAALFAEVPLADWTLCLRLHLLDELALLLPAPYRDARFACRGVALTGASVERPRWQLAIAALNHALGDAVGQLYVARHFSADHKRRVQAMVEHLMAAYRESIDELHWMTPQTRARAQDKLARYVAKIGYPEHWRDYRALEIRPGDALGNERRSARFEWARLAAKAGQPVDREEWAMTPQTVNAYYEPSLNEIVFPAGILQAPFFDMDADDATNYGAIGAVIGHEISHGFDDQGSRFDGDGALRNWWSDADRHAFDALGEQLVSQYARYEPIPRRHVNGRLTLGENIADVAGLQVAFKAFRRATSDTAAVTPPAGHLPTGGYSPDQRFFLGWAQVWRDKVREERALLLLTVDPHAPAEFRTNGAAVNHDGFHAAFATAPGDGMFKPADERIRVW